MPSSEVRRIRSNCLATIGQVGNLDHRSISLGKAGRKPQYQKIDIEHPLKAGIKLNSYKNEF